ncbi:MAG TPA: heparan-alpha-glucosaminide N-acetyltransferase domain-containing protein [Pyrinomonadaceae bacterium]|nr:heparan-alpha-glucosaminide N-acetyltransferase domain-containing protein [Pyrinomonadaceae bacterium]
MDRRIDSIDLLRGIVMVIMMLDHTRDFVHNAAREFDPTDLSRTNIALFFTRWITHFCAPTFVFLAGTSAYLQFARGKSKAELSRFLVTRGLWLILLEVTIVQWCVTFHPDYQFLGFLQVIWVIGVSMIVLAALIHFPKTVIAAFGLLMIALHNLTDGIRVVGWRGPGTPNPGLGTKLWILLHQAFDGFAIFSENSPVLFVIYPLIPWIGVMAVGYVLGVVYQFDAARRRRLLVSIGGSATLLFIIIRAINRYGDPSVWKQQQSFVFTVLSFINTSKYPPSLLFLLMTLGPAILLLALFETRSPSGPIRNFFITFGRVPLFFYVLQWFLAHVISILLHLAFGKPVAWLFGSPLNFGPPPQGIGFNLGIVYLSWIAGVLILYPLCKWFAGVKQRRRDWWLSYL